MSTTKPRRMRLNIVGRTEDQPRMLRAWGRVPGGEVALVLRPREGEGLLIHLDKKAGTRAWAAGPAVLAEGVTAERCDAPGVPDTERGECEAVAAIKAAQKSPPKAGPTTLRGQWVGTLAWRDGKPQVELRRKLATYGTLHVHSTVDDGWRWRFERAPTKASAWYAKEQSEEGSGYATLSRAIERGVVHAMALVQESCGFRDTRRRAAFDPAYARKHPIRPPKPGRNPTERLGHKLDCKPVEDGSPLPPSPKTDTELAAVAQAIDADAQALAGPDWAQAEPKTPLPELVEWFFGPGRKGTVIQVIGESLQQYTEGRYPPRDRPLSLDEFMRQQRERLKKAGRGKLRQEPYKTAKRLLNEYEQLQRTTPAQLERARSLVRYAGATVRSPRCQGADRKEALGLLKQAVAQYEEARKQLVAGQEAAAIRTIRRLAATVALTAAKASRSCARGQQSLTALLEGKAPRKPSSSASRKTTATKKASPSASRKTKTTKKPSPSASRKSKASAEPKVDPAKDAVLMAAFEDAILEALKEAA
ncbi:MAG: hypothetical protein H6739_38015 [Alphaproteobacteria bacterium]|nr:hypothetical protein [Alphaproteobacteria bacterium]